MNNFYRICLMGVVLLLFGCAHPITITPNTSNIDRKDAYEINKNVGYYISAEDRFKEVITPGGGGDSIRYTPYSDLEPATEIAAPTSPTSAGTEPGAFRDTPLTLDEGKSRKSLPWRRPPTGQTR